MGNTAHTNDQVKCLLDDWRQGDLKARDKLFSFLYTDLKKLSAALLRDEGRVSLSPGDLVHESLLRLMRLSEIDFQDKAHIMALSARMMRRVLIDHVRKKQSSKRRHKKVTLITHLAGNHTDEIDLIHLENALIRLKAVNADCEQIVEMRYFGGMSLDDIAHVTGTSPSTVQRRWRTARAWLRMTLNDHITMQDF